MKADEDYTTTVYVANKSDDGKTADLVYVLKKEIPTYDNTITFNGDGFTVVKEEGKFEVVDGNKIKVNDNQDVKFKLNITSGYELVSVKLGDEVLTASNGVYTINNVTKNLTVTVTTKPVAQAKGPWASWTRIMTLRPWAWPIRATSPPWMRLWPPSASISPTRAS